MSALGEAAVAVGLGALTTLSPCAMAGTVAAFSCIGRNAGSPRRMFAASVAYSVGMMVAYAVLGVALSGGLVAAADAAGMLQRYVARLLGPAMVLAGMLVLGLLHPRLGLRPASARLQRASGGGLASSAALGLLTAGAFCPTTAALFFLSLVPLAAQSAQPVLLPVVYGLGAAAPVLAMGALMAAGAGALGRAIGSLHRVQRLLQPVAGSALVAAGVYLSLTRIFGLGLLGG